MNIRTLLARKKGGNHGYNFKPHSGARERVRRLRQILQGKLDVPYEERVAAQNLFNKLATATMERAQDGDRQ